MSLSEKFNDPQIRAKISQDCAQLIDEQVAAKKGLGGLAIKAAHKVLKGLGNDYFPRVINNLLPKAMIAMDPFWEEGVQSGDPVAYMSQHSPQAADILLSVTDQKIANGSNKLVNSTYNKLRSSVKGDVEEAMPGLAEIIGRYA